jgi:hypothetical protein
MIENGSSPAAAEAATGPEKSLCLAAGNTSNSTPPPESNQAAIDYARRELLRSYVYEAAGNAAQFAEILQGLIQADDLAGIRYAGAKFAAYAREAARGAKELLGEATNG